MQLYKVSEISQDYVYPKFVTPPLHLCSSMLDTSHFLLSKINEVSSDHRKELENLTKKIPQFFHEASLGVPLLDLVNNSLTNRQTPLINHTLRVSTFGYSYPQLQNLMLSQNYSSGEIRDSVKFLERRKIIILQKNQIILTDSEELRETYSSETLDILSQCIATNNALTPKGVDPDAQKLIDIELKRMRHKKEVFLISVANHSASHRRYRTTSPIDYIIPNTAQIFSPDFKIDQDGIEKNLSILFEKLNANVSGNVYARRTLESISGLPVFYDLITEPAIPINDAQIDIFQDLFHVLKREQLLEPVDSFSFFNHDLNYYIPSAKGLQLTTILDLAPNAMATGALEEYQISTDVNPKTSKNLYTWLKDFLLITRELQLLKFLESESVKLKLSSQIINNLMQYRREVLKFLSGDKKRIKINNVPDSILRYLKLESSSYGLHDRISLLTNKKFLGYWRI